MIGIATADLLSMATERSARGCSTDLQVPCFEIGRGFAVLSATPRTRACGPQR